MQQWIIFSLQKDQRLSQSVLVKNAHEKIAITYRRSSTKKMLCPEASSRFLKIVVEGETTTTADYLSQIVGTKMRTSRLSEKIHPKCRSRRKFYPMENSRSEDKIRSTYAFFNGI